MSICAAPEYRDSRPEQDGANDMWQPQSGCGEKCLPSPWSLPTVPAGVQAGRLVAAFALLLCGIGLLPLLPALNGRGRAAAGRYWALALMRGLGVRLVVRGRPPARRSLLVSNHVSWLDILVLLAIAPTQLLAKREVRDWPVIGWLAAAAGTVFIDRSRPKRLPQTVADVAAALRAGGVVGVFPEGTTWCGTSAGRFRPAMFQAAIDARAVVVPVRLRFRLGDGESTSAAAFVGDETLWASLRRVLRIRGLVVAAVAAPALHPDAMATRRTLARVAEAAIQMSPVLSERSRQPVNGGADLPSPPALSPVVVHSVRPRPRTPAKIARSLEASRPGPGDFDDLDPAA